MSTIKKLLSQARSMLEKTSDSPTLDGEILLSHLLKKNTSYLFTWPERVISKPLQEQYIALLQRRKSGEPVAYLIGHWGFWNLDLRITPDTLIPRPETELLVEQALEILMPNSTGNIVDLGTGSGAIALAIASERPSLSVLATDQSKAALAVAHQNAQDLGISNLCFQAGSWFEAIKGKVFELIISNPPYIAEQDPHLDALRHEPRSALSSGQKGLDDITLIVRQAPRHLTPGGTLMFEHGYNQGSACRALLSASGFTQIQTLHDPSGHERMTLGRL